MNNFLKHYRTITYHRREVRRGCFKVGLYWNGITHDLSKYSPEEFRVGAKYYQGHRSPNNAEREEKGYSTAWLHHKGRNKHHYEYWFDYSAEEKKGIIPVKMPTKYIVEMLVDRVAACKIYEGKNFTDAAPYDYFRSGRDVVVMEKESKELLERLLKMFYEKGEEETYRYIRVKVLGKHQRHFI